MGKCITVILNVLSLALVGGAYAVHYFAAHRIGMVRWVNFHTQNIRAVIPIDVVKYVVLLGVILVRSDSEWCFLPTFTPTSNMPAKGTEVTVTTAL